MAATTIAGKDGAVVIPGTPDVAIGKLTDWTLRVDADNYEDTSLGNNWRTYVPGIRGWQGQMTGFFVADQDPTGQGVVENAIFNGNYLVIRLELAQGRGMWEGTVTITDLNVGNSVRGIVSFSATYTGCGSLQRVNQA